MIVFLAAVCFSSALLSMEDGRVISPLKSNKYLTLDVMKAAQALRDSALSRNELVTFCAIHGIDELCLSKKTIHAALHLFFTDVVEKSIEMVSANIFARDSSTFFASVLDKQYIGRHHAIATVSDSEQLHDGKPGIAAPPLFSPNGRWLVGWKSPNSLVIRDLDQHVADKELRDGRIYYAWRHLEGIISEKPMAHLSWPEAKDSEDYSIDYALDNETIVIQKGASLFCGALNDVAEKGIDALQKIYTDSQDFPLPQHYKVIHILSDGSIASVGRDSLRVFSSVDDTWSCAANYPIVLADGDTVVVNAHRGVAAVTGKTRKGKRQVQFYALIGSDAGKKGRIKVRNLIPESCAFSPAGLMFVLQQDSQSVPEIFNCARLKKNIKAQTCSVNNFQLALPATWNTQGIIGYHTNSRDDATKAFLAEDLSMFPVKAMSMLNTSRGFSILEGYLLHKEAIQDNGKAEQQ